MTCQKCKSEQPDDAKFCSECAAPLAESDHGGVKSKVPTWLAIVLLTGLAFIGITVLNVHRLRESLRKTAAFNVQRDAGPFTSGAATVNAASYTWYKFTVPEE